jgi:hypothetical protein
VAHRSGEVLETGWSQGATLQSRFDPGGEKPLEPEALHNGMEGGRVPAGTRDAGEGLSSEMETGLQGEART